MMAAQPQGFSFRKYAWRQFRRNKPAFISVIVLGVLVLLALFADLIATDQPLKATYGGKTFYPAFTSLFNSHHVDSVQNEEGKWQRLQFDIVEWKQLPLESATWAPIAWAPDKPDKYNRDYASPSDTQVYKTSAGTFTRNPSKFRHWLGTNQIGLDLAAGLIHGTRISLLVGLVSAGIAGLIGIILGSLAGFYGDNKLKTTRGRFWLVLASVILGFFYAFIVRGYALSDAAELGFGGFLFQLLLSFLILFAIIAAASLLGRLFKNIPWLGKTVTVPVDSFVSRTIEVLNSLPNLLLIITIAAIFPEKSLWLVMVIIGLTSWTGIARFTRAEFLRTRNLEFISAAQALGYRESRTIFRHALPNSIAPVFVALAFAIASAILVESSLSFLGIGVPDDVVTWGSLLSAGRQQFDAWWLVLYPGLAIFITVTIYNLIGEGLRDALDPRLKS